MKQIIKGKMYDTETAKMIGDYWNGLPNNDFRYCHEELYQKKSGEFFLYGKGGPLTKYKEPFGNMWGGGSRIFPMSEDEAKEWIENHLSADAFIELFGMPEE